MKIVGYARVSTEEQSTQGFSLDAQVEKIQSYAKLYDLDLVEVIIDGGYSAKTLDRPGLTQALSMLNNEIAGGLIVVKLDRLTRSVRDLDHLLTRYFNERFSLMSVGEQVDTRTAAGRLVLNVLMSVAQWEREVIGERTSQALQHKKAKGEYIGGVGYGYQLTDTKLTPATNYEVVATIVKMRAGGKTLDEIATSLNTQGVKTARGGKWYAKTVSNILNRENRLSSA